MFFSQEFFKSLICMCSIFLYPYYTKIYVKKLPDIMVFTPFYPTFNHTNPLCNVLIHLLCGRENTKQEENIFLLKRVHTLSPRTLIGRQSSLDVGVASSLINNQLCEISFTFIRTIIILIIKGKIQ